MALHQLILYARFKLQTVIIMLLRKLRSVALMGGERSATYPSIDFEDDKLKPSSPCTTQHYVKHSLFFISIGFLLFFIFFRTSSSTQLISSTSQKYCGGNLSVYMYELPTKFNQGLLRDCQHLNIYTDMCPHVVNRGLGQPITMDMSSNGSSSWYATHQFIAEMIFQVRVENHPCRTWEPGETTLFYVPFYGGLHVSSKFGEVDLTERDRLGMELVEYISQQPWWQRKQGRDHFLALGRTAWDFMRSEDYGENNLLHLPEVQNMSVLTVERHPWEGHNQYGIPYPSYLHPTTSEELMAWQKKMRQMDRPHLFSFVGAPRTGVERAVIREEILKQCSRSRECKLLKCGGRANKCHEPSEVLRVMTKSQFCLQPPGNSFSRRSTFDSVLAGCIPVFFSRHTAYTQYGWYLPKEESDYSVYFPEEDGGTKKKFMMIEEELMKIPNEKVERMRATVIDLIPRLTYMHPNATTHSKDAVDVALEQLFNNVNFNSSPLPTLL